MTDDITLEDVIRIRKGFMEVFVVGETLCSTDNYLNAILAKSSYPQEFVRQVGLRPLETLGVIFVCLNDEIQFTLMMDAGHALDAERQGMEHSTKSPLLKSVKKVTGDYPSVYGITEDIIIFINPQQWKTFLETEKKFATQYKSPAEILAYLEKCLNLGDERGA